MKKGLNKVIALITMCTSSLVTFGMPYAHANVARYNLEDHYSVIRGFVEDRAVVLGQNGLYGYINTSGQPFVAPKYTQALDFSEGYAQITYTNVQNPSANYYGYINANGSEVVKIPGEPESTVNGAFATGVALVMSDENPDRYIDTNGSILLEVLEPHSNLGPVSNMGLIKIEDDQNELGNFFGYMDLNGEMVIPFSYQDAGEFNNWVAPVKKNGRWGYIDAEGNTVIPFSYASATEFSDDGVAFVGNFDGKKALINKFEQGLTGFDFDAVGEISEGYAAVCQGTMTETGFVGTYGYINTQGQPVLPMIYEGAQPFSEGLAAVKYQGKWGYVDALGNTVIDFVYDYATPFENGNAIAKLGPNWFILAPKPIR
ncbi:MAG: hypothetical protein ATN31_11455 [Candidatus Epulonipiscioides saccharophilum]|nr:MAG: hypothetical protein ATN31_11455 [Epulopiscium sp. AS2M-Bin001]